MGLFHPFKFLRPTGRAGPSRCGAQCKTWARGLSEQWFYDVIAFSQPCYDRGRAQIYRAALTRELSTFANVRDESCSFWRERSLLTMKFIWRFYRILKGEVYPAKMNSLPKHHGAGPQRRGAQFSCISCLGLRSALPTGFLKPFVLQIPLSLLILLNDKAVCTQIGLQIAAETSLCLAQYSICAILEGSLSVRDVHDFIQLIVPKNLLSF